MRFKSKIKDCELIVRGRAYFDNLDMSVMDRFMKAGLRGFLKPTVVKTGVIDYTGPVGISLAERLKQPISKRDFYFIIEYIAMAIQNLEDKGLPLEPLVTDVQNIYINVNTKEVRFIYFPAMGSKDSANLMQLVRTLIYTAVPGDDKDNEFVFNFSIYFGRLKRVEWQTLESYISQQDRSVVQTVKQMNGAGAVSDFMTDKPRDYYNHYANKNGMQTDDDATGLLEDDDDESTGLLQEDSYSSYGQSGVDSQASTGLCMDDEATGLLVESQGDFSCSTSVMTDEEEGTMLLVENQNVHYPYLMRVQTNERINLDKPVFRLGKERSYVDYFVNNNAAVSRSHADIITRGSAYFVKDLNSKNHTYINNMQLPVQFETEIHDGDRLRLGNEDFIFYL